MARPRLERPVSGSLKQLKAPFQPRRFTVAPNALGCKRWPGAQISNPLYACSTRVVWYVFSSLLTMK